MATSKEVFFMKCAKSEICRKPSTWWRILKEFSYRKWNEQLGHINERQYFSTRTQQKHILKSKIKVNKEPKNCLYQL